MSGGRVDLAVRKKRQSNQYEDLPADLRPQNRPSEHGAELQNSPPPIHIRADSSTERFTQEEGLSGQTPGTLVGQRDHPTHGPIPDPRTFSQSSIDNEDPAQLTISTYQSSVSVSPMTALDNALMHGSRASSNSALKVEPGMRVLVVDDDYVTRSVMSRTLSRFGCKVTTAENGGAAMDLILGVKTLKGVQTTHQEEREQLTHHSGSGSAGHGEQVVEPNLGPVPEEQHFDLVFLDNQMPVLSGVKAVKRLRALGRKEFVVGITGNAMPEGEFCLTGALGFWLMQMFIDQDVFLEAGADSVLTKPVMVRSLKEALCAAQERRKSDLKEARRPS